MNKAILTLSLSSLLTTGYATTNFNSVHSSPPEITINNPIVSELNPFCKAILEGDINTVKRLIDLGENVNRKSLGMTPAMYAARYNKGEILELLMQKGANLSIKSDQGFTAEKYAQMAHANESLAIINSVDKG